MQIITANKKGEAFEIMVDDEDYPVLSRHKWFLLDSEQRNYAYASFYNGRDGTCKMLPMTHMIVGSISFVDHIDNNPLNNQKSNLRPASWQQNQWNKGKAKSSRHGKPTSKYKGVCYRPIKGKDRWLAHFKHVELGAHKSTGKMITIGYFWDEDEAARAYNKKIVEMRGERAWVNPVPEYNRSKDAKP